MFDELWSEIQDAPGEIFDLDIPELQDKEKFNFDEYLKGNYDYWNSLSRTQRTNYVIRWNCCPAIIIHRWWVSNTGRWQVCLCPYHSAPLIMNNQLLSVREQIQQDILSFASDIDDEKIFFNDEVLDELCEIVVRNFEKLTWNDTRFP